MAANTSLSTNFNVSPYFDDYDDTKDFHRVLFKPGLAVQTRELTQLQTILQDQVDRFGKNVFVEGSRVSGGEFTIDDNYNFIKLPDNYANGTAIIVGDYSGHTLRGATSNVTAIVVGSADGAEAETNTKTLFVKYSSEYGGLSTFTPGELVTSTTTAALSSNTLPALNSIGTGLNFSVSEGILFAKGNFIRFDTQSTVISRYSNIPTATVGFIVDESIVNSDIDGTLLDNAAGSFNYSAPGADRLKLTATLASFPSAASMSSEQKKNYVELLNIDIGQIQTKREATQFNEVRDFVAGRTKDFFGDTIIKGMGLRLREHLNDGTNNGLYRTNQKGDNNKLVVGVDTGKAYVEGYDIETFGTMHIPLDKGIDFVEVEQIPITANYGNFVNVNNVVGDWNPSSGEIIKLYNGAKTSISAGTYSTGAPAGVQIGQARFKTLQHDTGNPGSATSQFRIYLTDVKMSANTFADVRSVHLPNSTTANGHADLVVSGGIATIEETNFNKGLFQVPSSAVKTIRDTNDLIDTTYTFAKTFGVSISTAGLFTVGTGDPSEVFIGSGALNGSEKDEKFVLSLDAAAFATVTGTVSISGTAVTGTATQFATQFEVGQKIYVADTSEVRAIASIADATNMTLTASATTATTSAFQKYFAVGEIIDLSGSGTSGSRTVSVDSSTSSSFDIKETLASTTVASIYTILNKTDAKEIAKSINKNNFVRLTPSSHSAGGLTGPWNLGICDTFKLNQVRIQYTGAFTTNSSGSDVTTHFNIDDGQRDNFYDQSRLLLKSDSTLVVNSSAHLLVDVDYFTHDYSQGSGYFSVDSYPINDANAASITSIQTEEIPRYISPVTGGVFDLRNNIDTRPSKTYTAAASTTVSGSSQNPATSETYNSAAGGLRTPVANKNFIADYSYYLARRDILTLDKKGIFTAVRGVPSLTPEAPRHSTNAMKLATVSIAPYPSLTSYRSTEVSRPDYKSSISVDKQKRFTARDLSSLEQRITNLEYYTALNQVERKALDQTILDTSGVDRFKNGIFTDAFLSHKFGDYINPDYKITVDQGLQEIRPQFDLTDVKLDHTTSTNLAAFKSNTFFTLPHTHKSIVTQPHATTSRNIAGLFYTFEGSMTLSPDGDYWVDTRRNPDLNVDYDFTNVPWEQMIEPWSSNWGNWETLVTGAPSIAEQLTNTQLDVHVSDTVYSGFGDIIDRITTTATDTFRVSATTTSAQQRQRTNFNVDTTVETRNYGDRVVDVSLTPYLRSISIEVSVVGMKPNTKLTAFFDNEEVGDYCTQTDSSYSITGTRGGDLIVDGGGSVYLLFTIPNDAEKRFRVGDRMFVLTDSPTNSSIQGLYTTRAVAHFNGSGIQQTVENTIVSTRVPFISETMETDARSVSETTFLGTRADTRTVSVTQDFVISPTGKPYENVAWRARPSLNTLTSNYGSPGATLGECITKLNTTVRFWQLVSNSNATDIRATFETQMLEIFIAGTATQAALNQFMNDFNTITGSAINDISIRNRRNARVIDPVLQTFTIDDTSKAPGMFITKADVFFATKDTTHGVQVEIREIEQGTQLPTNRIVPNSIKILPASSINVSDTGATATTFEFEAPVYLLNGVTYGLTIKPIGNNSSTTVWVSRLGGEDISSGERVNEQPYVGVLYASSNDRVYTPIQEEDLKFNLYRADFDQTLIGELVVANENADYMIVSGLTDVFVVGETVTGSSTGSTGKVKEYYTDASGISRVVITGTNAAFSSADTLTGGQSGATVNVDTIYDVDLHVAHNELTSIQPSGTSVLTSILTTSNNNVVSTTYKDIDNTRDIKFNSELKVASRTTEINSLAGVKSYRVRNQFSSTNSFVSPVIDLSRSFVTAVGNRLNNSIIGEDSSNGGAASAKYLSKIVTLAEGQDAEDINVFLDEYRPSTSDIKVYVKILNGNDTETFSDKTWIALTKSSKELFSSVDSDEEFVETYYTFPSASLTGSAGEVQYQDANSVVFTGYKYFAIKIVMTGTNKATPPRVRNLRAIALQI